MKRILVMGLPGSGKTFLAQYVSAILQNAGKKCIWINADRVREEYNDWDFSIEGRIRQSKRMRDLADKIECDYAICDFVCPLPEMRTEFAADWTIWVDTIKESKYEDTNKLFVEPEHVDLHVTTQEADYWGKIIVESLINGK